MSSPPRFTLVISDTSQLEDPAFSRVEKCGAREEPAANKCVHEMVSSLALRLDHKLIDSSLVNLIPLAELQSECIAQLYQFLAHQYPRVCRI